MLERINTTTNTMRVTQIIQHGHKQHHGTCFYRPGSVWRKACDIKWYREESFYIVDRRLANYHKLQDRLKTINSLAIEFEYIMDYVYNGYDEEPIYKYSWGVSDYSASIRNDLEEYAYLIKSIDFDKVEVLTELIDADMNKHLAA